MCELERLRNFSELISLCGESQDPICPGWALFAPPVPVSFFTEPSFHSWKCPVWVTPYMGLLFIGGDSTSLRISLWWFNKITWRWTSWLLVCKNKIFVIADPRIMKTWRTILLFTHTQWGSCCPRNEENTLVTIYCVLVIKTPYILKEIITTVFMSLEISATQLCVSLLQSPHLLFKLIWRL